MRTDIMVQNSRLASRCNLHCRHYSVLPDSSKRNCETQTKAAVNRHGHDTRERQCWVSTMLGKLGMVRSRVSSKILKNWACVLAEKSSCPLHIHRPTIACAEGPHPTRMLPLAAIDATLRRRCQCPSTLKRYASAATTPFAQRV